jgi:hypothetical protein
LAGTAILAMQITVVIFEPFGHPRTGPAIPIVQNSKRVAGAPRTSPGTFASKTRLRPFAAAGNAGRRS